MLFNSIEFIAFFLIVYGLYAVLTHRYQNALLLAASYVFYGSWDWRFLGLMLFSTVMDYSFGIVLGRVQEPVRRRLILTTGIVVHLGFLFVFKFFNFFAENLHHVLGRVGLGLDVHLLNVI